MNSQATIDLMYDKRSIHRNRKHKLNVKTLNIYIILSMVCCSVYNLK